uniref:Sp2 transcription factor n=1 Tax=Amphiprion percula TaxID=161767 RepID=A0A3P8S6P7_AMPPE
MATTVAVSPSEYLQPSTASAQDTQPSPLALLAATCSKIGPPAAQAPVTSPPAQPQPRRLLPIKPAPIAPAPPKNLGFLSTKGNVIQLPAGLGSTAPGSPIVLTIQQSPARTNASAPANIQYQVVPQIQGAQTIQVMPQGGQIQLIPGTNQAIITTPMTMPAPAAATTPVTPQKTVAIKPSLKLRKPNSTAANMVQLPSGLTLPLNVATGEVGGTQIVTEMATAPPTPGKGRRGRKKKVVLAADPPPPPPAQAASPPPEQMETILIEAGDNIIQAGGRKERTLAKIAPAGGMITLNTSQLSSAAQAVQTISINGVQVQGVPVTITNAGGELMLVGLFF